MPAVLVGRTKVYYTKTCNDQHGPPPVPKGVPVPLERFRAKLGERTWHVWRVLLHCCDPWRLTHATIAGIAEHRKFVPTSEKNVQYALARLRDAGLVEDLGWESGCLVPQHIRGEYVGDRKQDTYWRRVHGYQTVRNLKNIVLVPKATVAWLDTAHEQHHGEPRKGRPPALDETRARRRVIATKLTGCLRKAVRAHERGKVYVGRNLGVEHAPGELGAFRSVPPPDWSALAAALGPRPGAAHSWCLGFARDPELYDLETPEGIHAAYSPANVRWQRGHQQHAEADGLAPKDAPAPEVEWVSADAEWPADNAFHPPAPVAAEANKNGPGAIEQKRTGGAKKLGVVVGVGVGVCFSFRKAKPTATPSGDLFLQEPDVSDDVGQSRDDSSGVATDAFPSESSSRDGASSNVQMFRGDSGDGKGGADDLGELLRGGGAGWPAHDPVVPPFPTAEVVPIVEIPPPPKLEPDDAPENLAWALAAAYTGAVEKRYKRRCHVFTKTRGAEKVARSKHFETLVRAAWTLCGLDIAPASWAAWSCDVWLRYVDPKGERPPPVMWVFSLNRIEERHGWHLAESTGYGGGRVVFGEAHRELLRRYALMNAERHRGTSAAEAMRKHLPGDLYDVLVGVARQEGEEARADLREKALRGDWIWD